MSFSHINDKISEIGCRVPECKNKITNVSKSGYCRRHWQQVYRYGHLLYFNYRKPNEIIVRGNTGRVQLYKGCTNEVIAQAIIDADDIPKVSQYKWHYTGGYAKNNTWSMAQLIMGHKWADHINGNRLDNRKSNLRPVTKDQNNLNRSKPIKNTSSRYKGVFKTLELPERIWRSRIKFEGKSYEVGRFVNEKEAAWMYDQWALELFGEYARTNFHYYPLVHRDSHR